MQKLRIESQRRASMESRTIALKIGELPPYEVGAAALAALAWPQYVGDEREMGTRHAAICQAFIREHGRLDPSWATNTRIKTDYLLQPEQAVERIRRELDRALRIRMVAARMAIGFLNAAEGYNFALPQGVPRLSINAMAALVLEDASMTDPENVKTRIWRPSRPVIHIALALAKLAHEWEWQHGRQSQTGDLSENQCFALGDLITDPPRIIRLAFMSQVHAALIRRSRHFGGLTASDLIHLRLV